MEQLYRCHAILAWSLKQSFLIWTRLKISLMHKSNFRMGVKIQKNTNLPQPKPEECDDNFFFQMKSLPRSWAVPAISIKFPRNPRLFLGLSRPSVTTSELQMWRTNTKVAMFSSLFQLKLNTERSMQQEKAQNASLPWHSNVSSAWFVLNFF